MIIRVCKDRSACVSDPQFPPRPLPNQALTTDPRVIMSIRRSMPLSPTAAPVGGSVEASPSGFCVTQLRDRIPQVSVGQMGVAPRGGDAGVAQEGLHGLQTHPRQDQAAREGVPKVVEAEV